MLERKSPSAIDRGQHAERRAMLFLANQFRAKRIFQRLRDGHKNARKREDEASVQTFVGARMIVNAMAAAKRVAGGQHEIFSCNDPPASRPAARMRR